VGARPPNGRRPRIGRNSYNLFAFALECSGLVGPRTRFAGVPTNRLFYGDNLDALQEHVATESVDLVYLDPPFNSNRTTTSWAGGTPKGKHRMQRKSRHR